MIKDATSDKEMQPVIGPHFTQMQPVIGPLDATSDGTAALQPDATRDGAALHMQPVMGLLHN